jgi:2-polyprenyl-3-methyl-5-hydroxy-6-metoxy-1,4-benzoquinol methylase
MRRLYPHMVLPAGRYVKYERRKLLMSFDVDKTIKFWNKASKNFDTVVYQKYRKPYDELISLTKKYLHIDDTVLDYACGTGIITNELSVSVKRILAIDISDQMIEKAKGKTIEMNIQNVEYQITNIFDSRLKTGSFSVILAFNILHFFKDQNSVLARINQLLTQDGLLISETGCFKERMSFIVLLVRMLSKLNLHPFIKVMTCYELENLIRKNHFELLETKVLFEKPVSYFVVAKKVV